MNILAMADESTLNCQRKYLRWPTKVLSFFRADLSKATPMIKSKQTYHFGEIIRLPIENYKSIKNIKCKCDYNCYTLFI